MDKLLNCPFCGEENVHVHDSYCAGNGFMVLCASCTAEGPLCNTEAEAATEWNRRASSSASKELPRYSIDCDGLPFSDSEGVWIAYSDFAAIQAAAPADADSVPIPTHTNMARMMLALGYDWLKKNAPEHLRAPAEDAREQQPDGDASNFNESDCRKVCDICFDDVGNEWPCVRKKVCRATGTDREQAGEDALVVVPEGWKLVPLVPTDEQIEAAHCSRHSLATWNELIYEYTKMVEVAPSPAAPKEGGEA